MRSKSKILLFSLLLLIATGCAGCAWFGGNIKPAPIAEGADNIVVTAERAQSSSLEIFRIVTEWEFNNRATLPPAVTRAIDSYRKEFPPVWRQSRDALKAYKQQKGPNATDMDRITTALLVAQQNLLKLRTDQDPNDVARAINALGSLINNVRAIMQKPVGPSITNQLTTPTN